MEAIQYSSSPTLITQGRRLLIAIVFAKFDNLDRRRLDTKQTATAEVTNRKTPLSKGLIELDSHWDHVALHFLRNNKISDPNRFIIS